MQLLELLIMAKFYANYGNFDNQPVSQKPLATERKNKLYFDPVGRKRVVQLLEPLAMPKFLVQQWQY